MKRYNMSMKLISWNVNGIRAVMKRNGFEEVLAQEPDILFVQETKASPDQIDTEYFEQKGYSAYFAHSVQRKGYSGVGIISRIPFDAVVKGVGFDEYDMQGRVITAFHMKQAYINVYVPNGGGAIAPLPFKLSFMKDFINYITSLSKSGYTVIVGGDINIAHTEIDLARPQDNKKSIGFLPEEREFLNILFSSGYSDVFRFFYPEMIGAYTYWDVKSAARSRNVGWRIDYWIAHQDLLKDIISMRHLDFMYGSDHCPLELVIKDK
jgi:exodeoxyribonuclease-3